MNCRLDARHVTKLVSAARRDDVLAR